MSQANGDTLEPVLVTTQAMDGGDQNQKKHHKHTADDQQQEPTTTTTTKHHKSHSPKSTPTSLSDSGQQGSGNNAGTNDTLNTKGDILQQLENEQQQNVAQVANQSTKASLPTPAPGQTSPSQTSATISSTTVQVLQPTHLGRPGTAQPNVAQPSDGSNDGVVVFDNGPRIASPQSHPSHHSGLPTAEVVGFVAVGVAFLVILALLVWYRLRNHSKRGLKQAGYVVRPKDIGHPSGPDLERRIPFTQSDKFGVVGPHDEYSQDQHAFSASAWTSLPRHAQTTAHRGQNVRFASQVVVDQWPHSTHDSYGGHASATNSQVWNGDPMTATHSESSEGTRVAGDQNDSIRGAAGQYKDTAHSNSLTAPDTRLTTQDLGSDWTHRDNRQSEHYTPYESPNPGLGGDERPFEYEQQLSVYRKDTLDSGKSPPKTRKPLERGMSSMSDRILSYYFKRESRLWGTGGEELGGGEGEGSGGGQGERISRQASQRAAEDKQQGLFSRIIHIQNAQTQEALNRNVSTRRDKFHRAPSKSLKVSHASRMVSLARSRSRRESAMSAESRYSQESSSRVDHDSVILFGHAASPAESSWLENRESMFSVLRTSELPKPESWLENPRSIRALP